MQFFIWVIYVKLRGNSLKPCCNVYNYRVDHAPSTLYQSGFLTGVSTVSSLYHSLCQPLAKKNNVRVVFLDSLKTLDMLHRCIKWFITFQPIQMKGNKESCFDWDHRPRSSSGICVRPIVIFLITMIISNNVLNAT